MGMRSWLIMVEGVGAEPGAPGLDEPSRGVWWGENLAGTRTAPVQLDDQTRLVYSPHTYGPGVHMQPYLHTHLHAFPTHTYLALYTHTDGPGVHMQPYLHTHLHAFPTHTYLALYTHTDGPGVYMQPYFNTADFPSNMAAIWEEHFGMAIETTGQPIVLGEIGGFYTGKDKVWQDWAFKQLEARGIGAFYFCLNPDSQDTGGLLKADWTSPEREKLLAFSHLPSTSVAEVPYSRGPSTSPFTLTLAITITLTLDPPPHPNPHPHPPTSTPYPLPVTRYPLPVTRYPLPTITHLTLTLTLTYRCCREAHGAPPPPRP